MAFVMEAFARISSRMRSKMMTLASTAIPMVRIIPEIPGIVMVAWVMAMVPKTRMVLTVSAQTATKPAKR